MCSVSAAVVALIGGGRGPSGAPGSGASPSRMASGTTISFDRHSGRDRAGHADSQIPPAANGYTVNRCPPTRGAMDPSTAALIVASRGCCCLDARPTSGNRTGSSTAEHINDYLSDYTDFSRPRNTFRSHRRAFRPTPTGWAARSSPTTPRCSGSQQRPVLLRGVVFGEYDGYQWYGTTASSRYRSARQQPAGTRGREA